MDKKMTVFLWVLQGLLAALFLFSGAYKLVTSADVLAKQAHMSAAFLKFIGALEVLGGLGLVLPGLTKIHPELTAFAAAGLVIIMIGAVVVTLMQGLGANAILPAVVGILCGVVCVTRFRHPGTQVAAPQPHGE